MGNRIRYNFVEGFVADNPLTAGATTLNSAGLSDLPAVTGSDIAVLTLDPNGKYGAPEIVYVTAHTGGATSATILRAQETSDGGGAARSHVAGTLWKHDPTAADFLTLISITYIAQGTTTYTLPSGINAILVECIGAGGGGGGAASVAVQAAAGSGAGGGAYASKLILNPADSYACIVGAGGAGGAAGNNNGANGADTSFDGGTILAKGGLFGLGMAAGVALEFVTGNVGGIPGTSVGDLVLGGGTGGPGTRLSGTVAAAGFGGAAPRGGGMSIGRVSAGAGVVGMQYGGGGSGGCVINGSAAAAGGAGANGRIIVMEYR